MYLVDRVNGLKYVYNGFLKLIHFYDKCLLGEFNNGENKNLSNICEYIGIYTYKYIIFPVFIV